MGLYDRDYMKSDPEEDKDYTPYELPVGRLARRKLMAAIFATILLIIFVFTFVF